MKMRELEAVTGVNRETIRVYLRHGLIPEPSRPKPNVADYGDGHVRAINAVRELQRNSTLTMKQIKEAIDGGQGSPRVEATAFQHLEALVATRVGIDVQPILLASLAKAMPEAASDAVKLQSIGVIDILGSPDGPSLSITDARLVTIWNEMRQAGFTEERGFTPEMLTYYVAPRRNGRGERGIAVSRTRRGSDQRRDRRGNAADRAAPDGGFLGADPDEALPAAHPPR